MENDSVELWTATDWNLMNQITDTLSIWQMLCSTVAQAEIKYGTTVHFSAMIRLIHA